MRTIPQITTDKSPREIILEDFEIDLPIQGGCCYKLDNACLIDKFDHTVLIGIPFDGLSIERSFVEKRIYEEMIIRLDIHEQ